MTKYISLLIFIFACSPTQAQKGKLKLIVGTYTNKCQSEGIYVYEFDTKTATMSLKCNTIGIDNPSYLTFSKKNKFIYAVNESGADNSGVSTFEFNSATGEILRVNKTTQKGMEDPCYIINDDSNVITANYTSGSISVFSKSPAGILEPKQHIQLYGKSTHPTRQTSSHIHCVQITPDKKHLLAADLGKDKIYVFDYNQNSQNVNLIKIDSIAIPAGSGPRHIVFNKEKQSMYLMNELNGVINIFKLDGGKITSKGKISVVKKNFDGEIGAADIHISPDGAYLYATNRGTANEISTFKISDTGMLSFVSTISTMGSGPRNFAIDPSGNFLLVAHQNSNDIVVFSRDKKTGQLKFVNKQTDICQPVFLMFAVD